MITKKRTVKNDAPWPEHWKVEFEYNGMASRKHEFQVSGSREWFLFERFVTNTITGKSWVDAFRLKPYDCFTAFYPERINKIRVRKIVAPRKTATVA